MEAIGLRPATPADADFCFELHRLAMGDYVAAIWGWNDADQREYDERAFGPGHWQIITVDGTDAGLFIVEDRPEELYLGRIELHPDHQGQGIGGTLIRALIDRAHAQGRHVTLDVLTVNPRAYALYRRLGFQEQYRHGDGDIKIRMRCA
ncbi:GNAT family N-acetyltransferase [Actinoallomurus sp. NPDC052274]|uniref:GNAT family N-acetyltransferase n=1 Tax=Actinoallomurus sp. NPDC052274 TaxID=3155420 RepID=UPI00344850B6